MAHTTQYCRHTVWSQSAPRRTVSIWDAVLLFMMGKSWQLLVIFGVYNGGVWKRCAWTWTTMRGWEEEKQREGTLFSFSWTWTSSFPEMATLHLCMYTGVQLPQNEASKVLLQEKRSGSCDSRFEASFCGSVLAALHGRIFYLFINLHADRLMFWNKTEGPVHIPNLCELDWFHTNNTAECVSQLRACACVSVCAYVSARACVRA